MCCMQNGLLFGLPVVFDTHSEKIKPGDKVLLTYQGQNIATLTVDSKWMPNKPVEALKCYGTSSIEHPAVQMISMERGKYYIGRFCFKGRCGTPLTSTATRRSSSVIMKMWCTSSCRLVSLVFTCHWQQRAPAHARGTSMQYTSPV